MLLLTCLTACQREDSYPGMRTEEERTVYRKLSDSVNYMRTEALILVRKQMEQAADSLTWYDYHLMYGRHFLLTETPDSLLSYVKSTLQFARNQQPQTPRTRGLQAAALSLEAAYMYLLHQDDDKTISLYKEAYRLMSESDIQEGLSDLSANLGDAYIAKNDLAEAARWYRRALFLSDSLQLPDKQEQTLHMGLGRIYTNMRNFEQARLYYEQADRHFNEMKPNMQSYFLNNYGNYFYYRKDYGRALQTFRRLKAHLEQYDAEKNFDMYLCKINLADVFLNLHQPDSARYYLAESEDFFREQHIDIGIYYARTIRIGIALAEGRTDDVASILQETEAKEVNDPGMLQIRNNYLNTYYATIGDYFKAYAVVRDNLLQNDSTEESLKQMQMAEIMMRLTEDTIRLHHQLELDQQQIHYEQTRAIAILLLALLIAIALSASLYFSYQRKRYLQTRLDMLSQRLLNARQRISPHFIFNLLNNRAASVSKEESDQLVRLAKLIRTNLDLTQKTFITLDQELDFVHQYVNIEQQVSGLQFDFSIIAPDKELLQSIRIPSMLIQILVENAILHGLKNVEGERRLCIKVEDMEKEVRVAVIDNGPGFDIRYYNSERARTGLNIIRSTVSTVNQENNNKKMHFDIRNEHGCHAILTISKDIKYPTK